MIHSLYVIAVRYLFGFIPYPLELAHTSVRSPSPPPWLTIILAHMPVCVLIWWIPVGWFTISTAWCTQSFSPWIQKPAAYIVHALFINSLMCAHPGIRLYAVGSAGCCLRPTPLRSSGVLFSIILLSEYHNYVCTILVLCRLQIPLLSAVDKSGCCWQMTGLCFAPPWFKQTGSGLYIKLHPSESLIVSKCISYCLHSRDAFCPGLPTVGNGVTAAVLVVSRE